MMEPQLQNTVTKPIYSCLRKLKCGDDTDNYLLKLRREETGGPNRFRKPLPSFFMVFELPEVDDVFV